jgi:hypothetical protein
MRDSSLIDAAFCSEPFLGESEAFSEPCNPFVDRSGQPTSRSLTFHAATVDQRSTSVKRELTTSLVRAAKRSALMGDARHKKSPAKNLVARKVTPLFIKQALAAMAANAVHNLKHKLKPGDPGYKTATHADLERVSGADANTIKHLFGGVRAGTKTKKIGRSKYVDPIANDLGIEASVAVEVPASRVAIVQALVDASDELWARFADQVSALRKEAERSD